MTYPGLTRLSVPRCQCYHDHHTKNTQGKEMRQVWAMVAQKMHANKREEIGPQLPAFWQGRA